MGIYTLRQEESSQKIQLNPLIFDNLVMAEVPLVEIYLVCMELICSIFGSFVIIPCTLFISYQLVPKAPQKMMIERFLNII